VSVRDTGSLDWPSILRGVRPVVTIRLATADERRGKFPPLVAGRRRIRVPKYVVVGQGSDNIWSVFGLPQGGDTRAEAVFWAERLASKNDLVYLPPEGWERIEGVLPERDS
jgi:hypothetical protein